MRDVWEISGVCDDNGNPIILREDQAWAYVEIGHAKSAISPEQARRLARCLYRVARRIDNRADGSSC